MFLIFLIPFIGLAFAFLINKVFPRAQFRGYDVLPFFFIAGCSLITLQLKLPLFLPYGFFIYFILVIIVAISSAIKNKNISLGKTIRKLWNYLTACTLFWYIGLLFFMIK